MLTLLAVRIFVSYMNGCAFICPVLSLPTPTCTPDVHVLNGLKMDSQLFFTENFSFSFTVPRKVVTGGEGRQAPGLDEMSLVHLLFSVYRQTRTGGGSQLDFFFFFFIACFRVCSFERRQTKVTRVEMFGKFTCSCF